MSIDVIIECPDWDEAKLSALADRCAAATLRHLGLDPEAFEIVLLACDDARIAALNADFRGKPQPTNVLSRQKSGRRKRRAANQICPRRQRPRLASLAISRLPGKPARARRQKRINR